MILGIYKIKNVINGDFYLGSSGNIIKRFSSHKRALIKGTHHNIKLQNAWNKYGEKAFKFIIFKKCLKPNLLILEQKYIDELKPIYNISKDATAPMNGRKHSKKTRKFLSNLHKGNKYNLGRKWTEEQRKNILSKRIGSKRSLKTRRKMSKTAKKINSIGRIDRTKQYKKVVDSNGMVYDSMSEAARITGSSVSAICDNLKGRSKKTKYGLTFKYAKSQLHSRTS